MGESVESNHLRTTIISKFPEQIIYQVNLLSPDDRSIPTLRSSLDKVITAMERSGMDIDENTLEKPIPSTTTEALQVRTESNKYRQTNKRKWNNFTREPPIKRPKRICIFCDTVGHTSSDCGKYRTMEARKEKLKGKCFKCFSGDHQFKACKRKVSCYNCKGDHLKLLCPKPVENRRGKDPKPKERKGA